MRGGIAALPQRPRPYFCDSPPRSWPNAERLRSVLRCVCPHGMRSAFLRRRFRWPGSISAPDAARLRRGLRPSGVARRWSALLVVSISIVTSEIHLGRSMVWVFYWQKASAVGFVVAVCGCGGLALFSTVKSLAGIPHIINWIGQPMIQPNPITATVQQIYNLNLHDVLGNSYIVPIVIKELAPAQPWWYMACAICKRTVSSEGNSYRCSKCGTTTADPRYRVTVHGVSPENMDKTNSEVAEFIFFAETAEQLIGCPVLPLITAAKDYENFIPPQIKWLYGRQYNLKVSVPRRALQRVKISYQVDSFTPFLCSPDTTSASKPIPQKTTALTIHESTMLESSSSSQVMPDSTKRPSQSESPVTIPSTPTTDIIPELIQSQKMLPQTDSPLKQPLSPTQPDVQAPESGTGSAAKRKLKGSLPWTKIPAQIRRRILWSRQTNASTRIVVHAILLSSTQECFLNVFPFTP